jgi:hypothetical protein
VIITRLGGADRPARSAARSGRIALFRGCLRGIVHCVGGSAGRATRIRLRGELRDDIRGQLLWVVDAFLFHRSHRGWRRTLRVGGHLDDHRDDEVGHRAEYENGENERPPTVDDHR